MKREDDISADDQAWLKRSVQQLDDAARDLDAATLSRLNRARQQALSQLSARRRPRWFWSAAFAAACSLVLAVGVWRSASAPAPLAPTTQALDFELVAGTDSLDLYDNDLEFYAWLEQQQQVDG